MRKYNKGVTFVDLLTFLSLLTVIMFALMFILLSNPHLLSKDNASNTDITSATNSAVFSINWTKKANASESGGNYQLSLPFSDYKRTGQKIKPNNHFQLSNGFHFAIPLLSKKDEQGSFPENMDEAEAHNTPLSIAFTPVASNQQQLTENAEWLSAEENKPQSTLTNASTDNIVRLHKPITLKQDNQIIATVRSLIIEKNIVEQNNSIDMAFNGMFSLIKMKNVNTGPGTFSLTFNNLDATLIHQLEKEVNDIKHLSKGKQMLMELKILKQLSALFKKESTVTLDYELNTVTGPVKEHYSMSLADISKAPAIVLSTTPLDLGLNWSAE